jgi:uncharacterized Zn finger protein (UPF0148 family)
MKPCKRCGTPLTPNEVFERDGLCPLCASRANERFDRATPRLPATAQVHRGSSPARLADWLESSVQCGGSNFNARIGECIRELRRLAAIDAAGA